MSADRDRIIIEKAKPKRKTIAELFADFDGEYAPNVDVCTDTCLIFLNI